MAASARHFAISPWRDQVEAIGGKEAARIVETNQLRVNGVCRGGCFPADRAGGCGGKRNR